MKQEHKMWGLGIAAVVFFFAAIYFAYQNYTLEKAVAVVTTKTPNPSSSATSAAVTSVKTQAQTLTTAAGQAS